MERTNQPKEGKSKLASLFDKIEIDKKKTKKTKPKFVNIDNIPGLSISSTFKGLNNTGNVCYSNVVIQCLNSIKEFTNMVNIIFKVIEAEEEIDKNYPVFYNLVRIMYYYSIKNTTLASNHIKMIVNMFDSSGEQNDAHEFLVFLFDRLNEEILRIQQKHKEVKIEEKKTTNDETEWEEVKKNGKRMKQTNTISSFNTSIIGKLFQGVLKHELEMKGQSLSKCTIEPFFILSLDFGENSVDSCFTKFFSKRKIESANVNASSPLTSQQSYIEKLPEVFIVHLKAFYYDTKIKKIVKIMKEIQYDNYIKLSQSFISPSMQDVYKSVQYELIGVIIHKGTKASEGHYTCFCKDDAKCWWNLDDKNVYKMDEKSIFKFRPYILFYRKITN